jgi:hypothetical protein
MDESENNGRLFDLQSNMSGSGNSGGPDTSYYRQVSVNLSDLVANGLLDPSQTNYIDVHWTMSCGNDGINGRIRLKPVPEPGALALMSAALLGIGWMRRLRARSAG